MTHEELFRTLRAAWFEAVLKSPPFPREPDSSRRKWWRDELNRINRERYDEQTDLLLQGDATIPVAPDLNFIQDSVESE